jgi:phage replication O-like protein O
VANPQKENGFTPIANEILESVYSRKFTANQLFILLVLWRYTYGFQRKDHDLSLGFISEATGIDRKAVKRAMDKLLENNVVVVTKEATFSESRRLAFNKNYESWNIEKRTKEPQGTKKDPVGKNDHTTGGEFDHSTGGKNDHQERNVKEILKKEDEEETNPVALYERNFFPLTPMQIESIWDWVDDFKGNQEVICMAIKETALKNPSSPFKYLTRILVDWHKRKLFTLEDVLKAKEQYEKSKVIHLERKKQKQEQPQGRYIPKDAVVDINAGEDPNWTWKKPF